VSQYSGKPENNLKWVKVHEVFGDMWFGRTVNDINHALLRRYEFVRGSVPVEHILKA
jgi:hypothetical protein